MTTKNWPEIYKIAEQLLEHEAYNDVDSLCVQISEQDPQQSRCWYIRSKAMLGLHRRNEAKQDILFALEIEPKNLEYFFHYCFVLVQVGESNRIPSSMDIMSKRVSGDEHIKLIGFISEAIDCGMVDKLSLTTELLSGVLRYRNKNEK